MWICENCNRVFTNELQKEIEANNHQLFHCPTCGNEIVPKEQQNVTKAKLPDCIHG